MRRRMTGTKDNVKSKVDYDAYRDGGEGFARWVEAYVRIPIYLPGESIAKWTPVSAFPDTPHPLTGRSYKTFWDNQKSVTNEALEMHDGIFKHNLIVLCWPRGDGKTFLANLIQLWRFFVMPMQRIVLCANSKDQTDFISFDIMKGFVTNSPELLRLIGPKNIQVQEMRLRDSRGVTMSTIRSVSSFSGIMSGITAYSFTEIHEMKSPVFFDQMHGSIRNVPNAFGMIDTTVSSKDHKLYHLFEAAQAGKDKNIFFSYRCSPNIDYRDYWHPYNTQEQLNSFRSTLTPVAFDRYYRNTWDSSVNKLFPPEYIQAMRYIGVDGNIIDSHTVIELLHKRQSLIDRHEFLSNKKIDDRELSGRQINEIEARLWPAEKEYRMISPGGVPQPCSVDDLNHLSSIYDTDWAILVGIDRAAPRKVRTSARTVVITLAKGLVGSRSNPNLQSLNVPDYTYIVLSLKAVDDNSLEGIKTEILQINEEYDGVDMITSEPWGIWDLVGWAEENGMILQTVNPSLNNQTAIFTGLFAVVRGCKIKCSPTGVSGFTEDDLLAEELGVFDEMLVSNSNTSFGLEHLKFGSPEKRLKNGRQDDSVFALGHAIYGGRFLMVHDFRSREGKSFFGTFQQNSALLGKY